MDHDRSRSVSLSEVSRVTGPKRASAVFTMPLICYACTSLSHERPRSGAQFTRTANPKRSEDELTVLFLKVLDGSGDGVLSHEE